MPCRQQLADVWGQDWQGFAGSDSQTPGEEQLLRPLVGSKGLLVLAPGRLLNYISTQVRTVSCVWAFCWPLMCRMVVPQGAAVFSGGGLGLVAYMDCMYDWGVMEQSMSPLSGRLLQCAQIVLRRCRH